MDAASSAATQAELDFAAIYGGEVYDPIADPTLPEPAAIGAPAVMAYQGWTYWVFRKRVTAEPVAADAAY